MKISLMANALSRMPNLTKQKGASNQTMNITIFYTSMAIENFRISIYWNISSIIQSKAKEKASLESFMFFFGTWTIMSSRSRPNFEAFP